MALKEDQRYGLSSRSLAHGGNNNNNISVFYVKLTDSAARAIDTFQNSKGLFSYPTICFSGKQGRITIPCAENRGDLRTFTFGLTNVARDNPHGSFNCVQQPSKCSAEEPLSCVGMIQEKLTVNATDDSYHKACQSMALVEEETRSRGAIVIKHEGRFKGKKVTVRAPSAALAKLAKPRHPSRSILGKLGKSPCVSTLTKSTSASDRKIACVNENRPLRERLIHLLALRAYKRPELVLRLQRDGLTPGDKDTVDTLLPEVAQHSRRDGAYVLKESLYKELHKDWPGYTTGDQQLLKRILVRRLFKPPSNLLSVPETQVSPLRDTPNSSPAHSLKHSLAEDYTDPLAIKKPRISHLTSKARNVRSEPQSIKQSTKVGTNATEVDNNRRNSLDPQKLLDSLTAVCEQEVDVVERLEPAPSYIKDSKNSEAFSQPNSDLTATPLNVPHLERPTRRKSKSKHRDQEKVKDRDRKGKRKGEQNSEELKSQVSVDCKEPSGMFYDSSVLKASDDMTDYLLKYTVICSHDQRQSYKQDFIEEYNEYRSLHACIDSVTRQFMALDVQLKKLHRGSHKYKTVHNQILQEYRKIKKSNPNYNEDKVRCEYLHNKLAHIKKLISEYDKSRSEKTADEGSALQSVPPTHSGTSQ